VSRRTSGTILIDEFPQLPDVRRSDPAAASDEFSTSPSGRRRTRVVPSKALTAVWAAVCELFDGGSGHPVSPDLSQSFSLDGAAQILLSRFMMGGY